MKKLTAIVFLSILAFNWLGYRVVFDYFEKHQDKLLEARLDANEYDESELISIKTPFSMPYFYNTNKFERWSGEIEIDGIQYKYVKRRFFNDTMELLCLPDYDAKELKAVKHDYYRLTNDLQTEQQQKKHQSQPVFKNLLSEYCEQIPEWEFHAGLCSIKPHERYVFHIPEVVLDTPGQPPEFC